MDLTFSAPSQPPTSVWDQFFFLSPPAFVPSAALPPLFLAHRSSFFFLRFFDCGRLVTSFVLSSPPLDFRVRFQSKQAVVEGPFAFPSLVFPISDSLLSFRLF